MSQLIPPGSSGNQPNFEAPVPRRHLSPAVPAEGANDLFTQSWFPICLSSAATNNHVRGFDFLDGRVIVTRDPATGRAQVLSAYCPHLGADLSIGQMVDGNVRCAFHHWQYNANGTCVGTGIGDKAPPAARLFRYCTAERHGLIWAFNGLTPHYELPGFSIADEHLVYRIRVIGEELPVDPWLLCANTPDIQHIRHLHGIVIKGDDPHDAVEWTDHSLMYQFEGVHTTGDTVHNRVGIFGTSLYFQETVFSGRWFGFLAPFGLPRPGRSATYLVVAARRDMGTAQEVSHFLDFVLDLETKVVSEDVQNMRTIRFRPGTLTRSDKSLARFFDYLRNYPRAHPGADFIR